VLPEYYESDAERQPFVTALFDGAARHYDRVCALMSFGSGQWYRRQALVRAGLRRDMKLLDVATGTGLVARAAVRVVGDPQNVIGIDPSRGMLAQARQALAIPLVQGRLDALPFPDAHFDFLSIGYALRHVGDLDVAFGECRRVLKPGGRLLVLEITRSPSVVTRAVTRFYFQQVVPRIMWATTRSEPARMLTRYYWDTIAACVPPAVILDCLSGGGFVDVRRVVFGNCLSEYVAAKPGA